MEAQLVRSGDIGDEAGRSAGDAGPLDLDAVRADDDLIEALSAGLVPPPSAARDTSDVEGELVALLAGWVADVRPETLLHRPDAPEQAADAEQTPEDAAEEDVPVAASPSGTPSLLEHNELPRPVPLARWRSVASRPYLLRAAAALVAVALVSSGVIARSYGAHPGEPLWAVTQMAFPEKSHSVEAAISVSTALNTARVALERGRIDEARQAFQTISAHLSEIDAGDGRAELDHQVSYLNAQLAADPLATDAQQAPPNEPGQRPLATGAAGAVIPSNPAVTPGATTALATPATSSSALAAGPDAAHEQSPNTEGTAQAPPAEAAPAPSGDALAAGPAPAAPSDGQASNSAPSAASGSADGSAGGPAAAAAPTTERPPRTTEPQTSHSTADSTKPQDKHNPPVTDSTDQGNPTSGGDAAPATDAGNGNNGNGGTDNSSSSGDSAAHQKDTTIDTGGAAGSNPGQVTGVVTNTSDSGS